MSHERNDAPAVSESATPEILAYETARGRPKLPISSPIRILSWICVVYALVGIGWHLLLGARNYLLAQEAGIYDPTTVTHVVEGIAHLLYACLHLVLLTAAIGTLRGRQRSLRLFGTWSVTAVVWNVVWTVIDVAWVRESDLEIARKLRGGPIDEFLTNCFLISVSIISMLISLVIPICFLLLRKLESQRS